MLVTTLHPHILILRNHHHIRHGRTRISLLLLLLNELLLDTAVYLHPKSVNAFMRANRRLHHLLAPLLDRLFTQNVHHVLSWAARNQQEGFFELAISRAADSHRLVLGSNKPPLFFAATNRWDNSVRLLIDNGAHSVGDTTHGHTALHVAVLCKQLSTTRLLLDRGWSPSVPADGVRGTTPLHLAIWTSTYEIIELLIERGANAKARVDDQSTLESAAQRPAGLAIIKLLLINGFDTTARDSHGERALDTAFREAVKIGDGATAQFLFEQGADIKCRSPVRRETALHTAARLMHWHMVEMLLSCGVEINARNGDNETALFGTAIGRARGDPSKRHFVCFNNDGVQDRDRPALLQDFNTTDRLPVMKLLLDAGIHANARDNENNTVLFRAICRGTTPLIQLLLHHSADINAPNSEDDSTALHAAAGCGDVFVVQALLANGSDINSQTKDGCTALHVALQHRDLETVNVLLESGIDISVCTKLLHHFDNNPYIADGASALYLAVRWGHEDLAKQLLAMGASVDVQYHLKCAEGFGADVLLRSRMAAMFEDCGFRPVILCEGKNGDVQRKHRHRFTYSGESDSE